RAASERGPQTGDRWPVSNPGLILQVHHAQTAHRFHDEVVQFVRVRAAAGPRDPFATVHYPASRVFLDECGVSRLLHMARNLVDGRVPVDVLPAIRPRPAHLGPEKPPLILDVLLERGTLGTQRAAVDRVIRIALD